MNGYNGAIIDQQFWQAVIQPKAKVTMAMLLQSSYVHEGICPSQNCKGKLLLTTNNLFSIW
jgi:hypothetical protein